MEEEGWRGREQEGTKLDYIPIRHEGCHTCYFSFYIQYMFLLHTSRWDQEVTQSQGHCHKVRVTTV